MRISSATLNRRVTQDMMNHQVEMAKLQSQISSGKRLSTPSDDPVNAARQVNLAEHLSQIDQYDRNINLAEARLVGEETYLANSENILLRVRELALISNNATTSPEVNPALVTELEHLKADLLGHANAKDADGNFIFAGTKTSTKPFTPGSNNTYQGDSQQRMVRVNQTMLMATSDSGQDIFQRIPASDLSHSVISDTANTGEATIVLSSEGTGTNPGPSRYRLEFPTTDTYNIINLDTGTAEVSGAALPASNTIEFEGLQLSLSGDVAANDAFNLEPSTQQDVFETLQNFIDVLKNPPTTSAEKAIDRQQKNEILNNVDQAFEHMTLKRASVGSRLASLDSIRQENLDTSFQLTSTLSGIEDLDYADAISQLQQRATALEALQKTITRTQGLTLFNN